MSNPTRRSFMNTALFCSAGALLAVDRSKPHIHFPSSPRSRIAVASYPFRAFITAPRNHDTDSSKPAMDLAGFARFVKSEFQVHLIEPLDGHFPSKDEKDILLLCDALKTEGMGVANIPVDEQVDLCNKDEAVRVIGGAAYRRWIDIARTLGSPSIRITLPRCAEVNDIKGAVHALRPTLTYAESQGVVVLLENDDPVLASDQRILSAIREADTPYLRALPDFANSLMGGDERFNTHAVENMFTRAYNMAHVKDAELIDGKRRTASLSHLFGIAKQAGYRGYYSMESDSNVDPVADTKQLIAQSISLM